MSLLYPRGERKVSMPGRGNGISLHFPGKYANGKCPAVSGAAGISAARKPASSSCSYIEKRAIKRPNPNDGSRPLFILVPETARSPNRPKSWTASNWRTQALAGWRNSGTAGRQDKPECNAETGWAGMCRAACVQGHACVERRAADTGARVAQSRRDPTIPSHLCSVSLRQD